MHEKHRAKTVDKREKNDKELSNYSFRPKFRSLNNRWKASALSGGKADREKGKPMPYFSRDGTDGERKTSAPGEMRRLDFTNREDQGPMLCIAILLAR